MKPNLFDYATSELSQDAFLAWFFKWAEKDNEVEDKALHDCALESLQMFVKASKIQEVNKIKIIRQRKNIDLWIVINDEYHLIIEDKTATSEHDNQLQRYKDYAKEWFDENNGQDFENHFDFVYYKSGDITPYEARVVEKAGYHSVSRKNFYSYLLKYKGSNSILIDYRDKLEKKQAIQDLAFNLSFEDIEQKKKKDEYVKGFYQALAPHLDGAYWKKVNNPGKQYFGMWWYWCESENFTYYLQLNEFNLQIRICNISSSITKKKARTEAYTSIMKAVADSKYKGLITKPKFGTGKSMAVALIDKKAWLSLEDEKGSLDMEAILVKIQAIENFLWEKVLGNI